MDPLSKTGRNVPVNSQTQIPAEESNKTAKTQQGVGGASDSFESSKVDTLRAAYSAGKSEGKRIMSDSSFNHVLQNNLTPRQYPEAFKDLKGFVRSNFALTPDQTATLNRLPDSEVRKFQNAGAMAAQLNKPIHYESVDLDPTVAGAKDMKFQEPLIAENAINLRAECQRAQVQVNQNIVGG
jgi:hypothetical protein